MIHACKGQCWREGCCRRRIGVDSQLRGPRERLEGVAVGWGVGMPENHEHWFVQTAIKVSDSQFYLYSSKHDWVSPGDEIPSLARTLKFVTYAWREATLGLGDLEIGAYINSDHGRRNAVSQLCLTCHHSARAASKNNGN